MSIRKGTNKKGRTLTKAIHVVGLAKIVKKLSFLKYNSSPCINV